MTDKTYNGWTNYATWRVNLEIFDGMDFRDVLGNNEKGAWAVGQACKEYVNNYVYELCDDRHRLIEGWISAFLSDVNWYEIAEHLIEDEEVEE